MLIAVTIVAILSIVFVFLASLIAFLGYKGLVAFKSHNGTFYHDQKARNKKLKKKFIVATTGVSIIFIVLTSLITFLGYQMYHSTTKQGGILDSLVGSATNTLSEFNLLTETLPEELNDLKAINPFNTNFSDLLQFQSTALNNAEGLINLNRALPLGNQNFTLNVNEEAGIITVVYPLSTQELDAETLAQDLFYNTAANFALVQGLNEIAFTFEDQKYSLSQAAFAQLLGISNLSELSNLATWASYIVGNLNNQTLLDQLLLNMVIEG